MSDKFYCAIGIETNGLIDNEWISPSVLHFAIIVDDCVSPLRDLETLNLIIAPDHDNKIKYHSEYVAKMHEGLNKKIDSFRLRGKPILHVDEKSTGKTVTYCRKAKAHEIVKNFLLEVCKDKGLITLAGKNIDGFDTYVLQMEGILNRRMVYNDQQVFNHRAYDVGSMYADINLESIPSLGQILKHIGHERPSDEPFKNHALLDAYDVVKAVRHKLNIPIL